MGDRSGAVIGGRWWTTRAGVVSEEVGTSGTALLRPTQETLGLPTRESVRRSGAGHTFRCLGVRTRTLRTGPGSSPRRVVSGASTVCRVVRRGGPRSTTTGGPPLVALPDTGEWSVTGTFESSGPRWTGSGPSRVTGGSGTATKVISVLFSYPKVLAGLVPGLSDGPCRDEVPVLLCVTSVVTGK